jgi:hypothetical protein
MKSTTTQKYVSDICSFLDASAPSQGTAMPFKPIPAHQLADRKSASNVLVLVDSFDQIKNFRNAETRLSWLLPSLHKIPSSIGGLVIVVHNRDLRRVANSAALILRNNISHQNTPTKNISAPSRPTPKSLKKSEIDRVLAFRGARTVSIDDWISGRWSDVIVVCESVSRVANLKSATRSRHFARAFWLSVRGSNFALAIVLKPGQKPGRGRGSDHSKKKSRRKVAKNSLQIKKVPTAKLPIFSPLSFDQHARQIADHVRKRRSGSNIALPTEALYPSALPHPANYSTPNVLGYIDDSFETPFDGRSLIEDLLSE